MADGENGINFARRFLAGSMVADEEFTEKLKQVDPAELAKIIDEAVGEEVGKLQTFMDLAKDLKAKQDELDVMARDTLPAAILTAYLSDILEPNNNGDLVSLIAKTPQEQTVLDTIFEQMGIPLDKVAYSLLTRGIAIAKFNRATVENPSKDRAANEAIKVAVNYGELLPEIEIISDTTTVFPIIKHEKCIGFIEVTKSEVLDNFNWMTDTINYEDVVIHSKLDYAYVKFGVSKSSKPLQLRIKNKDGQVNCYDIDVGCSLLENSYSAWKTLTILQDSIVLASLIKNATTIIIETEAGNMSDAEIQVAKVKLKSLFEGKLALGKNGLKSYISPQAKPNYVYSFTSGGVGAIKTETVGGEYNPGQLYYMDPFVNAFFSGMNYPKQQMGFGESAGLDGGGAVEEYTKRYLSTVSLFKRLLSQFIKNCINAILMSREMPNLVNNYEALIYKSYKEEDNSIIQMQQQQLQVMNDLFQFLEIEDPIQVRNIKLAMVKKVFSDKALLETIEEAMMEKTPDPEDAATDEEKDIKDEAEEFSDETNSLISDIESEGSGETPELPAEVSEEPAEGGEDVLPPMLGTIPEGEE